MKKTLFIIIFSSVIHSNTHCQTTSNQDRFSKTFNNIYSGIKESVEWYDLPIAISFLSRNAINSSNIGNKIILQPSSFEINFSNENGKTGRYTAGSMDKDIIPDAIFYTRLSSNVLLNLLTDAEINKNSYKNIFAFRKSLLYTYTLTEYVKNIVKRERPDGSDTRSFFSGHTATTFAAATYLWKELDDFYDDWDVTQSSPAIKSVFKISTFSVLYGWAGFVGYSRIRDDKHYLSDVIVGAAVGTLISHFVYEIYNRDDLGFIDNLNLTTNRYNSIDLSFNIKF